MGKTGIVDPDKYDYRTDEVLERKLKRSVENGTFSETDLTNINNYLNFAKVTKRMSNNTAWVLVSDIIVIRRLLNNEFHRCTEEDVYKAVRELKSTPVSPTFAKDRSNPKVRSQNTVIHYLTSLKKFFKFLISKNISKIDVERIDSIQLPKKNLLTFTPSDILDQDEIEALVKACMNHRDMAFVTMLYDGGYRSKEICTMKWRDVKFEESFVITETTVKTGVPRRTTLTRSVPYLMMWRNDYPGEASGDNAVFISRNGTPFKYGNAEKLIQDLKARAEENGFVFQHKISLYQFRRANITHDANANRPISHICMEKWGTSYSKEIERYNKPQQDEVQKSKLIASGMKIPKKRLC